MRTKETTMKPDLRNRANSSDRPTNANDLRQVGIVKADSLAPHKCKEGIGHDHRFQRFDRYGCCAKCGDEVLT